MTDAALGMFVMCPVCHEVMKWFQLPFHLDLMFDTDDEHAALYMILEHCRNTAFSDAEWDFCCVYEVR